MLYIISKLFTYIFLPPGIFIIALFLASFYVVRFRFILKTTAVILYLLSNIYISGALIKYLEAPYDKDLQIAQNVDAVVVLSGGANKGRNLPLGSSSLKRVTWALFIAKSQNLPLVFSGGGVNRGHNESTAFLESIKNFQHYLDIKIPISKTFAPNYFNVSVEDRSLNTYQNAQYSKLIFEKAGIKRPSIYLVSSAYHMKRAIILFRHFGFRVIPAATDFKRAYNPQTKWGYFPTMGAFKNSYIALHEYFGILSLYLRGAI